MSHEKRQPLTLEGLKNKLKQNEDLSSDELHNGQFTAIDVSAEKIGKGKDARDFMQCALMSNNKNNALLLSDFFDLVDYIDYLKTLSKDTQENMKNLFQERVPKVSAPPGMRK
jgi:hypothetical protein